MLKPFYLENKSTWLLFKILFSVFLTLVMSLIIVKLETYIFCKCNQIPSFLQIIESFTTCTRVVNFDATDDFIMTLLLTWNNSYNNSLCAKDNHYFCFLYLDGKGYWLLTSDITNEFKIKSEFITSQMKLSFFYIIDEQYNLIDSFGEWIKSE